MKQIQITSGLLISLFVLVQMVIGASLIDSVVLASILSLNIISGSIIWTKIFKTKVYNLSELIGVGIALGTLVPAFLSLISATLGLRAPYLTLMFPVLVLGQFVVNSVRHRLGGLQLFESEISESYVLFFLPLGGLIAWGFNLGALVYITISALAIYRYLLFRVKRNASSGYVLIVLGVLATFILDREAAKSGSMPIWRKFLGVDTVIDEAMSFGVVHFGINDSLLNTGNPIRLHVLSHSWAGDLSRISNADAFMVSGAVGYFIGLLGISFLLHSIGFSLSGKRTIGVIASALFFFQASMPEELVSMPAPRMANAISMLWFLFSVYLLIRSVEQNRNIAFICYPVLVSLVTMAKAQWGLFLLIASSPLIMAEFRKNKTATVFSLAIACMAFVTSYLLLIGAAANDHATNPNTIIEFTLVQGCSLFVFAILRTPIIHILMLGNIGINHSYRNVFLVGMACLPVVFVFNGGFLTTYLYYPIILLSTPIVATIVFEQIEISGHEFRSQIFVLLGIVLGAAGFLSYLYANYRFIDSNRSDFLSILIVDLPMLIPFLVIVALATLSYPFYKNSRLGKKRKERLNSAIRFIAVLAVAINFGVFAVQANRQDVLNYFYDSSSKVDLAVSDSMLDVGQWIRENSDPSSIVATNYFCKNSASTDLVALFPEVGDCRTRNELAWVGATSKRRMLIEAPLFVTGKDMSSDEANRYSISLNFGLTGSNAAMNELQKYHVNYFVLDKRQSVKKNWNIHEETVFSRGDFLVLKITK